MSTVKIEKGIPIPPTHKVGCPSKYPWATMAINESFVMNKVSAKIMCSVAGKKYGRKFICRPIQPRATHRVPIMHRVWRTA